MAIGKGFAKLILFGEHFVVAGLPGIASGIDKYVQVEIDSVKEDDIIFNDKFFSETVSKRDSPNHILCKLFDAMFSNLGLRSLKITITGNCFPRSGMGYSAALNVALARAINLFSKLGWDENDINQIAYKGECLVHGTPSGIDNTCATYGSLVWFEKNLKGGENEVVPFKPGKPMFFVLGDTKIRHDTKKAIKMVMDNKKKNPTLFNKIFSKEENIISQVKKLIETGAMEKIGSLMNENQKILRKIGVSCEELEILIKIALENGAFGAKLTGAGCGGLMMCLCKDAAHQELIIQAYQAIGFSGIKVMIK